MAENKPTGWKIRRGNEAMGTGWKIRREDEADGSIVSKKPPMGRWAKISGNTKTGLSVAQPRPAEPKATAPTNKSSYSGGALRIVNGRVVGPSERERHPQDWMIHRAVPGRAKTPKVKGAPAISVGHAEGPRPSPVPAVSATPSATSRGYGVSAPETRMVTPTTSKKMGTAGASYSGPKPEELLGKAADEMYPGVSTEGLNKLSEPEKKSLMDRAYKLEEDYREGRIAKAPTIEAPKAESSGLGLTAPKLKEPGTGFETPAKWGVIGVTGYGAYKIAKGTTQAAWKGANKVTGRTARKASAARTAAAANRLGALSAPAPGPQAAPASPTGTAPPVTKVQQPAAVGAMPRPSAAAAGQPPPTRMAAGKAAQAAAAHPSGVKIPGIGSPSKVGPIPSASTRTPAATASPPAGSGMPKPSAKPATPAASPSPSQTAMSIAKGIQGENLAAEQAEAAKRAGKMAEAETLAKTIQAERAGKPQTAAAAPKPARAPRGKRPAMPAGVETPKPPVAAAAPAPAAGLTGMERIRAERKARGVPAGRPELEMPKPSSGAKLIQGALGPATTEGYPPLTAEEKKAPEFADEAKRQQLRTQGAPASKKVKEAASKAHAKQTLERFGADTSVAEVSKLRAKVPLRAPSKSTVEGVASNEAAIRSILGTKPAAPEAPKPAPETPGMPKPSGGKPPKTKPVKVAPNVTVETPTPAPAEPQTPATLPEPSKVGHTTFTPAQQREAEAKYRELARLKNEYAAKPESLEHKQAYEAAQQEAKDWIIKQGGVRREADNPLQPPKPKTITSRPLSDKERSRRDMRAQAEAHRASDMAARRPTTPAPFETPTPEGAARKAEDKKIKSLEKIRTQQTKIGLKGLLSAIKGDKKEQTRLRKEAAKSLKSLVEGARKAAPEVSMTEDVRVGGIHRRPLGSAPSRIEIPFITSRARKPGAVADIVPKVTPSGTVTEPPSLQFMHTPQVQAQQLKEEADIRGRRAAKARRGAIAQLQGMPAQPSPAELRAQQGGEIGGIGEQTPAQRAAIKAIAERTERARQTQVGGSAISETPEKAAERMARRAQVEQHMKTKGYTKIEAGGTFEHVIEGKEPKVTRIGPQPAPRGATAEGMPQAITQATQESAAPEAPKVEKKPRTRKVRVAQNVTVETPTPGMPQPSSASKVTPDPAAADGKQPGRFRLGKAHGTGRTRPRKGRGVGGKLGLAGIGIMAYGAAKEAQAAPAGQKAAAVARYGAEAGVGMAKDLLTLSAATAAAGPVGTAAAMTYFGARDVKGILESGFGAAASGIGAYQQRKASEAKWGEAQYQAAIAKQRKKGLR